MMNEALKGLIGKYCFVYLDDVIIFRTIIEEHIRKLSIVFQGLRDRIWFSGKTRVSSKR